jgi:DNA-binding NarL/FixJ family response regulator
MRVVVADDHQIVREGISWLLSEQEDIEIVGEAEDGSALLDLLREIPVDVVLLDVRMPGVGGLEALEKITAEFSQVSVIMLSMHDEPAYVRRAVELGAAGYLLKKTGSEELAIALRAVGEGKVYIQGEVTDQLVASLGGEGEQEPRLSPRELQVLKLLADGLENKQIARELGISEATVKTYVKGIFERLEARSRAEAVANGLRRGLIQ